MSQDYERALEIAAKEFCKNKFCYAGEKELLHYFKEGAKIATEYWRSQAGVEFDFDNVSITIAQAKNGSRFIDGARWQFDKLLPVIGALKEENKEHLYWREVQAKYYNQLEGRSE